MNGRPELQPGTVRPAVQAGRFYDADPVRLRRMVEQCLASQPASALERPIRAVMAPHAGYIYSGRVAGAAYRAVATQPFDHVLVLGPSHFASFSGAALPAHQAFATPLGELAVDQAAVDDLARNPGFVVENSVHATEHALEVQLPFLQVALAAPPRILPVAVGMLPTEGLAVLADPLTRLLAQRQAAGERWLIVASTDTYHGYDAGACLSNDQRLTELLRAMSPLGLIEAARSREIMACGWLPLALTMELAQRQGATCGLPLQRSDSRRESGRASDYVVGYIAAAFL